MLVTHQRIEHRKFGHISIIYSNLDYIFIPIILRYIVIYYADF